MDVTYGEVFVLLSQLRAILRLILRFSGFRSLWTGTCDSILSCLCSGHGEMERMHAILFDVYSFTIVSTIFMPFNQRSSPFLPSSRIHPGPAPQRRPLPT